MDSFFEMVQDSVCWANCGSGKTLLGALATWLDTVFKTGCATKVLGGSLEQSKRMYEHLTGEGDGWGMVTEDFRYLLRGDMLAQRTVLSNQSNIQILTASSKSVRRRTRRNLNWMRLMRWTPGFTRPPCPSP